MRTALSLIVVLFATPLIGQDRTSLDAILAKRPKLPECKEETFTSGFHIILATVTDINETHVQLKQANKKPVAVKREILSEDDQKRLTKQFSQYTKERKEWQKEYAPIKAKYDATVKAKEEAATKEKAEQAAMVERKQRELAERVRKEQAAEKQAMQRLGAAISQMSFEFSKVARTGNAFHRRIVNRQGVWPIIVYQPRTGPVLAVRPLHFGDDWLFISKITAVCGNLRWEKPIDRSDRKSGVLDRGKVLEWANLEADTAIAKIFEAGKPITVRIDGDQFYAEVETTKDDLEAIAQTLEILQFLEQGHKADPEVLRESWAEFAEMSDTD